MDILKAFLVVIFSMALARTAITGDPDILTDFVVPSNLNNIDGNFFTFTGMRAFVNASPPTAFKVLKASLVEFPALNGQSVSYAVLQFPTVSTNPPHTHPRSAELLFLVDGSLQVGFVDTTNKLFTQTLQAVQCSHNSALAISAFGSANAGTVSLPNTLFATNIDDNVLAISFKTDVATIQALKAALVPKH
ncbi:hypothetical protein FNV43_RR17706 [Rhamnella rubrinervis]|uniref:Cupin type-1 domain-containing protein n=1 Tax=Rhamnella rubrinervis TaxID=2594499 RepID=A0A8K0E3P4_9ROSA|nr:hypothetical protein FNV43_RR17706 [Rhamnella rubrinervis]